MTFYLDYNIYNISTILEQTEYYNQWIESLSGKYTMLIIIESIHNKLSMIVLNFYIILYLLLLYLDARTKGWWMVNSVYTTLTIVICYFLVVWLTPRYMKNRSPFNLKLVLIIYNIIMIFVNLFIIIEVNKLFI